MKKLSKKLLSVLTAAAMIFTVLATPIGEILGFTGEAVKASAATIDKNGVLARIEELKTLFPTGSYFTTTGTLCNSTQKDSNGNHTKCDECRLEYVLDENLTAKNTIASTVINKSSKGRYTCYSFATFAFSFIFQHDLEENKYDIKSESYGGVTDEFLSVLRPGDFIKCNGGSHYGIFLGYDASYIYMYDSNSSGYSKRNMVLYNRKKSRTGENAYTKITAVRSKNYVDTIDLNAAPNNLGTQFVAPIKVTSTGKVLTAGSDGNVTVQTWTGADNQRWIFTKNSSDNYYEIRNGQYYQKVLDVADAGNKDDANIQIWEDNDTSAQRFGIYGSQGSYVIKPKYSTKFVIDSDGGNNNVHLWTYYSPTIDAQKFTISPEPTTRFDTFSATNITNNDARVKCKAYKRSEDKAVKYGVVYAPADTWNVTSTRKSFYSTASTTNVGSTYREIYFDFGSEIGDTLKPDTTYNYYFVAVYSMDGVNMTFSSSVQSFKTTNTCTHTFGSWTTKTSASCTADGLKQRTCSKCGKVESATITKLGHSYTSSVTKAATCTATGVRTYKCSRCTSSYTESIAKTGHTYTTGYEAAHPHKNYKKCTVCSTVEYTGTTQYLYNCASCTNLTVPTITSVTSPANINKEVTIKWTASTSDKLGHYWITIRDPSGTVVAETKVDKSTPSYTFTPKVTGEYSVTVAATPLGSPDGSSSLWQKTTITVHDIARYYEATHPHKYVDYCKNCDYMVYVGTNLGYYEKCKTCHDNVAPSKPVIYNVASTYTIGDDVIINWDATTNTTHYNLTVFKKNSNGEYEKLEWTPYVENGHVLTGYGVGDYKIYLDSYNSGYFYQYSESWRDWVHTQGDVVYFSICDSIVSPVITDITGKVEGGKTTITWTASPSTSALSHYWISISDPDGKFVVDERVEKTTNKFTFTPEKAGVYKVYVFAGDYTYESNFTVAPARPTLSATAGDKQASLSWTAVSGASYYQIIRYNNGTYTVVANINGTSATVKGLTNGYEYTYLIKAVAADGRTSLSNAVNVTPVAALAKPTLSATAGNAQATLKWTAVSGASYYQIIRYNNGTYSVVANVSTTSATVKGLTNGYEYTYLIKAVAADGRTSLSSAVNVTPVAALAKPTLSATAGNAQASLKWTAVSGASYYQIIRYNNGTYSVVANVSTTSATVKGLTNGYEYTYLIKAVAADGRTSLSNAVNVTPVAALAKPTLSATAGNGQATLSWTAVSGASYYQIIRYNNGTYTVIANISGTSATVKGLTNNYAYTYLIKAVAADGRTSLSSAVNVTPVAALAKPTLSATAGNGQATLKWTAVSGASYYQIIRYNNGTYTVVANISTTSATVKGLTNNYAYTYLIKAVAADGRTSFSNAVNITPKA